MSNKHLESFWKGALAEAERKIARKDLLQQIRKRLLRVSELEVIEINKTTQKLQAKLKEILSDAIGLKIDVWGLIAPTLTYPPEPEYGEPDLLPYPSKQVLKRSDAPSFDKAPVKRIVTIEDMRREAPKETVNPSSRQNLIIRQFKQHPYVSWSLVILLLLSLIGGK